jgi:hypothetical protein
VTDFFQNFEADDAAGGMDTGMDLDTDAEFPHLSPSSGSSPGGDPIVTVSPAVVAMGTKSSLPLTRGSKGAVNRTQFRPGSTAPDNPLEFAIQVQVQPVLPDGTCYLVAVFPFPPFPWRACILEMVARIQQHFERVRSLVRPDLALPYIRVGRIALRGGGNSVGVYKFWVAFQEATEMREAMEWLALLRSLSGSTIWLNSLYVGLLVSTEMVDLQRPRFNENMLTAMPWELPSQGWFTRDLAGSGCILIHTPQLQPSQMITDVQGAEPGILIFDVLARTEKGLLPRTSWLVWMADPAQAARLCISCEGFLGSGGSLWSCWNQSTLMWKAGQAVSTALLNEARLRSPPPVLHSRQSSPPSGSTAPAASNGGAPPASPLHTLPPLNLEGQSVIPVPRLGFIVLPPQGTGPSQPTGRLLI